MIEALLLGNAQDAGVPQIGCLCPNCAQARSEPALRQWAASLAVILHADKRFFMIDATPDFREQIDLLLARCDGYRLGGILLTHAHMGHYPGLLQLGPEAWNSTEIPVYATARMSAFLAGNQPWSGLIRQKNIQINRIRPGAHIQLAADLVILPVQVPHREEYSDTVAYSLAGPNRSLFYCPDIDSWDAWDQDIRTVAADHDLALLDGSFYSPAELPGRDLSEIPHPLVGDTVTRLAGLDTRIFLIHLNHSNPLHRRGPEYDWLAAQGMDVGRTGMHWSL